ncbi:MAG: Lrp/AsnC family transcriptional regulator [Bdellovibrionales bacterium]|nr:Lrp/AsnC family transcriptional regulator [Bdellovibrionales bacterium]
MRLSEKEAHILTCLELSADLGIPELRRITGYREHTLRYALNRLVERGIVTKSPFINLAKLGFTLHNIFFSLSSDNKKLKDALLKEMVKTPEVSWVAEFGGDYQYGIEICAFELAEVQRILYGFSEKFGNIFFQKAVSTQFAAHVLPRRYLSKKKVVGQPLSIQSQGGTVAIDELDEKILSALAQQGNVSHRQLAKEIGVPLSTFELRVKNLKKKGVILGSFYQVNPASYGASSYKLIVYGKGVNGALRDNLLAFADRHPNIISMFECFGSWDYELGVEVFEPREVASITQELYEEFGSELNNIQVLSKFQTLKLVLFPTTLIESKE